MKIYKVMTTEHGFICFCERRKDAEFFADRYKGLVEEVKVLDTFDSGDYKRDKIYKVEMNKEGKVILLGDRTDDEYAFGRVIDEEIRYTHNGNLVCDVVARDPNHAVENANGIREDLLEDNIWNGEFLLEPKQEEESKDESPEKI